MRFILAAAAASLILLSIGPAQAAPAFGAGRTTCAQFIKAARKSDILYHQASNWLLGYVSGMNAALSAQGTAAGASLTSDQVMKSAGDFCVSHPASTIADAARAWYPSLPREAAAPPPPQQPGSRSWTLDLNKSSGYTPMMNRR